MIECGFDKNLMQMQTEKKSISENMKKLYEYDKDTFFGSYIDVCKAQNDQYETNPFFSEMPKPESPSNNDPNKFFGAFINQGLSDILGIPKLSLNKTSNQQFEEEYKKYLQRFPNDITNYAFNNIIADKESSTENSENDKSNEEIFPSSYLHNFLDENNIYNTGQTFTSRFDDNLYKRNILSETCYMNMYKMINYDLSLQKEYGNLIYPLSQSVDQTEFYDDLIYLIQGIPSKTFVNSKKFPFNFQFAEGYENFRLVTTIPRLTKNIFSLYIDFGTKMQLINYILKNFLFKVDNSFQTPFVLHKFYSMVNDIMIQVNEKIIYYKKLLHENKMTLISLHNKIDNLSSLINILFILFNLSNEENLKYDGTLENYFSYYIQINLYQKSHILINSLLNIYFSFQTKDKNFFLVKNLLLSSLHSYLYFILYLLFTGEVVDAQREYFILQSGKGNFALDSSKVPFFLSNYKNVLLNNTILVNYIKKYDESFYSVLSYRLEDLIKYLDLNNIIEINTNAINDFIKLKDEIFNKKIELMFEINEKIINQIEYEKNEDILIRINNINFIKNFMTEQEKAEVQEKEKLRLKKKKIFEDLQEQVINKKKRIEYEILKIKNEQIEKEELEKERELLKNEIITILKEKYEKIREKTKDLEVFGEGIQKWKILRHNNTSLRNELFNAMYDEDLFHTVYPRIYLGNINDKVNYHFQHYATTKETEESVININDIQVNVNDEEKIASNEDNLKKNEEEGKEKEEIKEEKKEEAKEEAKEEKKEEMKEEIKPEENKENSEKVNLHSSDFLRSQDKKNLPTPTKKKSNESMDIDDISVEILPKKSVKERNKEEEDEKVEIKYPNFFITNVVYNEILMPIIETALDLATDKDKKQKKKKKRTIRFISHSTSREVDLEISEILNKMNVILLENSENLSQEKTITPEIPIQIIIHEFFQDIIIKQFKISNHTFVLLLKNKFNLLEHFDFFHDIFLCNSGDLILRYIEKIFDFRTLSLKSNDPEVLSRKLKDEISQKYSLKSSLSHIKALSSNYKLSNLTYNEKFVDSLLKSFKFEKQSSLNLNFSISNLEMSFQLSYTAQPPLDLVLNGINTSLYDKIFKKLLKHQIYNQIIVKIYSVIKNMRNENNSPLLKKITRIFNECYRTVKTIQTFIFYEVIEIKWKKMRKKIKHSVDIYDIIQTHNDCLKELHEIICNHNFFTLVDRLYSNFSQFYLKAIIIDYFDFETVKEDKIFLDILKNMKKANEKIIQYIQEEYVIGEFYELKKYL